MSEEAKMRGEEKGMDKGKEETAINMWRMGLDVHIIAEATGLTKKAVRKLTTNGK